MTADVIDLETSVAMAEVRLACLMVDYRDRPEIRAQLDQQGAALAALRRRLRSSRETGDPSAAPRGSRLRRSLGFVAAALSGGTPAARAHA